MLSNLNKQQREAVILSDLPLRLVAGPGSGKTRVITTKIGYLIKEKGVVPSEILAITFTNKATNEMRKRLIDLLNKAANEVHITTFHSLCFSIIKRDGERLGISKSFSILDDYSKKQLLKVIVTDLEADTRKKIARYNVIELISYLKNNLISASDLKQRPGDFSRLFNRFLDLKTSINLTKKDLTDEGIVLAIAEIFAGYETRKKEERKQDFDDLIINAWRILNDKEGFEEH